MHEHHARAKPTFAPIHIVLAVLIAVVLLFNAIQINNITGILDGPEPPAKPEVKVTLIQADCTDCADFKDAVAQLRAAPSFTVTDDQTLDASDKHALRLMQENNITRLPALVIEGEIEAVSFEGFTKTDSGLVLQSPPPYYDVVSGSVKGLVSIKMVRPNPGTCDDCTNVTGLGEQLKALGIGIAGQDTVDASSADGKSLIEAYEITKLPAIILSSDLQEYPQIAQQWVQAGDIAPDGSFVLRTITPPYYDLVQGKVRGAVDLISIVDATCATCYNVSLHKSILQNFGISLSSEKTFDVASTEGKNLINQYNISLVPTIIMTGDQALYDALTQVWDSVGSVEKDGAYVFRRADLLQGATYKDVTTGKVTSVPGGTA